MDKLATQVAAAVRGDKKALENVVLGVQDMIYNLAVRMLWHPDEARDATQEVLIRLVTNLSSFKQQSSFKTWVYRLTANTLINYNRKFRGQQQSFSQYAADLQRDLAVGISYTQNLAEQQLLVAEAKIGCSNAMLQCLNDQQRLVYILGEILELNSQEVGEVLDITPATFRKQLSRVRNKMHAFLRGNCGLVNPSNPCRCRKKVDSAIQHGHIQPNRLLFAAGQKPEDLVSTIDQVESEVALYRTNPEYAAPAAFLQEVSRIIAGSA